MILLGHGSEEALIGPPLRAPIFTAGLILMWPMFVIFWVIVQAVGALLQVRMFWVRWMFAVIRAALWRVVEYDKGAIAAVILIATAALTIVKELLAPRAI